MRKTVCRGMAWMMAAMMLAGALGVTASAKGRMGRMEPGYTFQEAAPWDAPEDMGQVPFEEPELDSQMYDEDAEDGAMYDEDEEYKELKVAKNSVTIRETKKHTIKIQTRLSKKTKITYEVSNPKVATVSKKGVIRGLKAGKTTVTVTTSNGYQAIIEVTVKKMAGTQKAGVKKGQTSAQNPQVVPEDTTAENVTAEEAAVEEKTTEETVTDAETEDAAATEGEEW
ncbi:MAG: Ig domain-containing protein [Lachnospiraceae bacterium]